MNWIRKEDRVPDPVRPPGRVGLGTGARAVTTDLLGSGFGKAIVAEGCNRCAQGDILFP